MALSDIRFKENICELDKLLDKHEIRGEDRESFFMLADMFKITGKMSEIEKNITEIEC